MGVEAKAEHTGMESERAGVAKVVAKVAVKVAAVKAGEREVVAMAAAMVVGMAAVGMVAVTMAAQNGPTLGLKFWCKPTAQRLAHHL